MAKKKKQNHQTEEEPIARAADIRYNRPLDEDDWEARERMEAAEHRAMKK